MVGPLLAEVLHDPRWLGCDVALISGGKSNLTYRVACDAGEVILRRPPLGHILPTAHDMVREHRVLSALEDTAVPVPRTLHLGDADSPLGAPFYVMERVSGTSAATRSPAATPRRPSSARRSARGSSTCSPTCTRSIPPRWAWPSSAGRPASWSASCAAGRSSGRPPRSPSCRRSTRCATSSCARCPSSPSPRSCTATTASTTRSCTPPAPGSVVAVLDWEMSTLGDPFTDLGALLSFWAEESDPDVLLAARIVAPVTKAERLPVARRGGRALRAAHRFRRVGHRLVPGVLPLQARGRLPGHRRARGRGRDGRLRDSTTPSAWSRRSWTPAGTCSAPASSG